MTKFDERYYLNVRDLMESEGKPRLFTGDATYIIGVVLDRKGDVEWLDLQNMNRLMKILTK